MDKKTRNLIIIGSIVTFIVVPVAATLLLSRSQQPQDTDTAPPTSDVANLPNRSNDELAAAIKDQSDALAEVPFVVVDVKKPQKGWYIVIIRNQDDPDGLNPAKVLLQDTTAGLSVLLGPGTAFPAESTQSIGVPDDVARELNS
jgi:hypothetical protein